MTQPLFNWTILLALIVGLSSCNGQVKKDLSKETQSESILISDGHPKLIKTQDSKAWESLNSSLQDKEGNLWFGTTAEGLYKYDGKSFNQFTIADGLNSNMIYCLFEDKDANIWLGTETGLCLYDGKTFTDVQIDLPSDLPPNKISRTHDVFNIIQDKNGKLWFATIDGVYIYDGKSFIYNG